jgi:4-amino-4-deoxy-L-arabinose transferase-like glycosyltransferase
LPQTYRPLPFLIPSRPSPVAWFGGILFAGLLLALFIHLGLAPLRLEEPRRALISLEMLFQDNWVVPTEMGEYYYKKPPVYNWVIGASYWLWGNHSEWAVRFLSVVSFVATGGLVFVIGRHYVDQTFGIYAGLLTLAMVDIVFYFSTAAGEIDLFYSLITLASFFTLFHFYQRQQYYTMFIITYAMGAVGTLTKGLPSPVFLGVSVLVWLAYRRDLKRLFTAAHLAGIGVVLALVGGYFAYYNQFNDVARYFSSEESLWSQTSERTAFQNSIGALLTHLVLFPLETLKNVAPATLLLPFLLRRGMVRTLMQQPFVAFCALMLVGNGLVYWLSPGTRSRYIYMLYPLLVIVLTYAYHSYRPTVDLRHRIFRIAVRGLLVLTVVAGLVLLFVPLPELPFSVGGAAATLVLSAAGLLLFQVRQPHHSLLLVIALVVLLRLVFNFTILPARATSGTGYEQKQHGLRIAQLTQGRDLHLYPDTRFSLSTVFYIERARQEVLAYREPEANSGFYLVDSQSLSDRKYTVFYTFAYYDRNFLLVTFGANQPDPALEP